MQNIPCRHTDSTSLLVHGMISTRYMCTTYFASFDEVTQVQVTVRGPKASNCHVNIRIYVYLYIGYIQ